MKKKAAVVWITIPVLILLVLGGTYLFFPEVAYNFFLKMERNAGALSQRGVDVQTLIVWGAEDKVLHASGASVLQSVMPGTTVVILENVGHLAMVEKPEETARSYLDFLKNAG